MPPAPNATRRKIGYPSDLAAMGNDANGRSLTQMKPEENLLLYALVVGLKPKACLEIGRSRGGSTLVISSALSFNGGGVLVSLDPEMLDEHLISADLRELLSDNVRFCKGLSPGSLAECGKLAGAKFDFILIDGDHTYEGCMADSVGVLPHAADGAYLLYHDANFPVVMDSIDDFARDHGLTDCGLLSVAHTLIEVGDYGEKQLKGRPSTWGGFRLLRRN